MRKVTDLLPSEAILISSGADLKVLEEFEKEGVMWIGGIEKPTEWNPSRLFSYPYCIFYENDRISWSVRGINPCPATDFIPNDPERGLTILKGDGSIISAQNQDGRVFDIEPIPTESDEVEKCSTIESVFKLAKWILENRVSSLIDADISQEDKDRIARHFGYSADLTNP